jgi:anti-sigma factor RsiW
MDDTMTERIDHIEWETLNDYADGVLDEHAISDVRLHLERCADCRMELEALRTTVDTVSAGATAPVPAGLWNDIAATIESSRAATRQIESRRSYRFTLPTLAAAASLLILASVAGTLYLNRSPVTTTVAEATSVGTTPVLQLTATDVQFVAGVEALERQLQSQRASLQPSTIAIIEKSLATIDAALLEARVALLADPANAALKDVLETTYRQKMDFLTRAAKIAVGS